MSLDRRELLKGALLTATTGVLATPQVAVATGSPPTPGRPMLIDVNVSLFQWPFRRLAGDSPDELVARLKSLGVTQAWAGSFEGILHRDVAGVNARLTSACRQHADFLEPFGTVNITLPDWEDDLRRCHEDFAMPGIRLHPSDHGYTLDDPLFVRLLALAGERGLLVQLAVSLEDTRTRHERWQAADVDLSPLPAILKQVPQTHLVLLNHKLRGPLLEKLAAAPQVWFDTARVDGTEGIATLLKTAPESRVLHGSHAPFLLAEAAVIKLTENELFEARCRERLTDNARRLLEEHAERTAAARPRRVAPVRGDALPGRETKPGLTTDEVWDSYFWPTAPSIVAEIERLLPVLDLAHFRRVCLSLHVGLGTADAQTEQRLRTDPDSVLEPLRRWPDRILGFIQLNANDVAGSLAALDRWLLNGPMLGVYFPGSGKAALACNHPNFDPLVERIQKLGGVIMQHTWFKTGGKDHPGGSTPAELAELAARHPEQTFIAAHAGGEWEKGIRAVRALPNVLVETSGFDPTSGFIDLAVRELGAERIVFGSHLPGRSLGTELGKVLGARLTDAERRLILAGNLQRLLRPQMLAKGLA